MGEKIALYRQACADHGHDPEAGHVTLMLYTYLGDSMDEVRRTVREPLTHYLETSANLWQQAAQPLEELSDSQRQDALPPMTTIAVYLATPTGQNDRYSGPVQ